jgi:hypothetical protein
MPLIGNVVVLLLDIHEWGIPVLTRLMGFGEG